MTLIWKSPNTLIFASVTLSCSGAFPFFIWCIASLCFSGSIGGPSSLSWIPVSYIQLFCFLFIHIDHFDPIILRHRKNQTSSAVSCSTRYLILVHGILPKICPNLQELLIKSNFWFMQHIPLIINCLYGSVFFLYNNTLPFLNSLICFYYAGSSLMSVGSSLLFSVLISSFL